MKKTEREWKASLIYRIWIAVERRLGQSVPSKDYRRLSAAQQSPFQYVATTRSILAVEEAWTRLMKKRSDAHKSPWRAACLTARAGGARRRG